MIPGFDSPDWPPTSTKANCPCECGLFGTIRKKTGHVRLCPCKKCAAPRYRQRAARRERKIAKDFGGERQVLSGALSGADVKAPGVCIEETASKTICGPVRTAWNNKAARIMERRHRFAEKPMLVLADEKPWLVVMLYEDAAP